MDLVDDFEQFILKHKVLSWKDPLAPTSSNKASFRCWGGSLTAGSYDCHTQPGNSRGECGHPAFGRSFKKPCCKVLSPCRYPLQTQGAKAKLGHPHAPSTSVWLHFLGVQPSGSESLHRKWCSSRELAVDKLSHNQKGICWGKGTGAPENVWKK